MPFRGWCLAFSVLGALLLIIPSDVLGVALLKGSNFSMKCFTTSYNDDTYIELLFTPSSGDDSKLIAKYKPSTKNVQIEEPAYTNRLSFTSAGNAVITNIIVDDEGSYKCTERGFASGTKEVEAELQVLVRPQITVSLLNSPLEAGTEQTKAAECKASDARPEAVVSWSSERYLAYNESSSTLVGSSSSVTVTTAVLSVVPTKFFNDQPFICTVTHPSFPSGLNATMKKLIVNYPPSKPVIEVINQNTQLKCKADGNPVPIITWDMPPGNTEPNAAPGESVIRIISPESAARQNDTYTCHANNQISPSTSASITTAEAVTFVEVLSQSSTGLIIGIVIGCIVLLAIIGALVYWFCIRKMREKDTGPYPQKKIVRQAQDDGWSRSSSRPIIQHANEGLNRNPPPEPSRPPPDDEDEDEEHSNSSHSDVGEFTEGHDVELNGSGNGIDDEDAPAAGIISKNSVNFQPYWRNSVAEHRRKRPSTSPHRRSQTRNQSQSPPTSAPQADPHYEVPPMEYYDDEYDEQGHLMQGHGEEEVDDRFYDRPEDRYPGYQTQPRYDDPPVDEQLPPYTDRLQYASIDHSYNPSKPRTRPTYQEPVEYAEIRSHGQIV